MYGVQTGKSMKLPIMMYHEIADDLSSYIKTGDMHSLYYVSSDAFKAHLQLISNLNFSTITLSDLSKYETNANSKIIALSFDDGYIGNYLHAFPALINKGMRATFFCAVSLVGKENMMTWSQLKEMIAEKMSIQSHGYSHRPMASMNKQEIYEELKKSKNVLEDKLGEKVSYFSLPHGSFNECVINAAKEVGYDRICTSLIGYNEGSEFCLQRILASSRYDLQKYEEIITGKTDFSLVNFSKSVKQIIKNIIGHKNYLNIYHFVNKYRNLNIGS